MQNIKSWFQSKTIIAGVITIGVAAYNAARSSLAPQLPEIPEWVFIALGGLGVYGRVTADSRIV
jgi:hypothetical protein